MAYNPNNPNGQATMANSAPVVIASNQTAIPITDNSSSITVDGSVTVSGTVTANAGTGTMNVSVQNASIPVTDNGSSLTIDGTVTANAGTGTFIVGDGGSSLTVDGTVTVTDGLNVEGDVAWNSADDNTWGSLTGTGWITTYLSAQYRNLAGNDASSAFAYQFQSTAGATNQTTLTQLTLGPDNTTTRRITFYETVDFTPSDPFGSRGFFGL